MGKTFSVRVDDELIQQQVKARAVLDGITIQELAGNLFVAYLEGRINSDGTIPIRAKVQRD